MFDGILYKKTEPIEDGMAGVSGGNEIEHALLVREILISAPWTGPCCLTEPHKFHPFKKLPRSKLAVVD